MPFDGKAFVLRQDLVKKPCPSARPAQIGVRAGGDQVAVQDRLDDVLQARSLPDDLVAPGHLPAKRLRRLIWNPDFRQKPLAYSWASTLASIVSVLIFAWAMMRTCFGFAITTFLTCGAITAATEDAFPVASITTTSSFESFFAKASRRWRRMSTRPSRLSLPSSQATASAKARWISNPMIRMPAPPSLFVRCGSWRATRHLLIRAHGASGKVARGGHVTS